MGLGRDPHRHGCIVTVPFVLLRHMEIDGLDSEKWFTIRNVYYGRAHDPAYVVLPDVYSSHEAPADLYR